MTRAGQKKASLTRAGHDGLYPKIEKKVHQEYKKRRSGGRKVSYEWLKTRMWQLCLDDPLPIGKDQNSPIPGLKTFAVVREYPYRKERTASPHRFSKNHIKSSTIIISLLI